MKLSDRINHIEESRTVQFTPLIEKLKQLGKTVIDFAVGEPEYETPGNVIESTKKALDDRQTRYGPVNGLRDLRSKLAEGYDGYDARNILISNGSKQSLFLIFQVILNPLDEVIIPRPYWVSFAEQVKLAGAVPVFADTLDHQLDVNKISELITKKTRALIINSPNNPTGAVYSENDLASVLQLAMDNNMYVVSDEAYRFFVYDGLTPKSLFNMGRDKERLITINSFSKQYNMTGFRIGYMVAHEEIVKAVSKYQSHASGNVCTFSQYGALAALNMGEDMTRRQNGELEKKRDMVWQRISRLFDCIKPQGAFYIFPKVTDLLRENESASDFAADLLEKAGVAVVPGEAFGLPGHVRISYAVEEELLVEGLKRIEDYIGSRKKVVK